MKNTKFLLLLLPLLASCDTGGTSVTSNTGGDSGTDPVFNVFTGELERNIELKVLENDTAIANGYFQELLDAFNEEYKEYGIKAVDANIGEYSDLATMGPYGTGPDVLYQANDVIMKYVDQQHVRPLPVDKLEAYPQLPDLAKQAYRADINGKSYQFGVPINIQSGLLYYREDLLPTDWETKWDDDKNGVPDMVENLSSLYAFSKEKYDNNDGKYGFVYSLNDFYFSGGFLFTYGGYVFGDNGRDTKDIGLHQGNAKIGAQVARDLASVMPVDCYDDTAKLSIGSAMASGKYFASMTTPDVGSTIINNLALQYQEDDASLTEEQALAKAEQNVKAVPFPAFPKDGDVTKKGETTPSIMMGGINGYAMSSYTKYPNASLAFINFATSYEMVKLREEILDIAPCREDVAENSDRTLSQELFEKVASGAVSIMPSVSAIGQVWSPAGSFFADLARDPRRNESEKKYDTLDKIQTGLEQTSKSIYDAIHILS